jgi:hypothetical protein
MTLAELLLHSGSRSVRRGRADCPFCRGRARLTVAFSEAKHVAYCHRCQWSASAAQLAEQQGVKIAPRSLGKARLRRLRFEQWLDHTMSAMANEERRLARRAEWAKAALGFYPDDQIAWTVLSEWHHIERRYETFWSAVRDRIGRRTLYLTWRCANG